MDKIKKIMTVMAVVGTILVTGVFCYMPVREVIKEHRKNTVSMEEVATIGTVEDEAQELKENMTDASEKYEDAEAENGSKENNSGESGEASAPVTQEELAKTGEALTSVIFRVRSGEQKLQISIWKSKDGIGYVFLPGFANGASLQVAETEDKGFFSLGGQPFYDGDVIENLSYEEAYAFTFYDKKGNEVFSMPLIFMYSSELPVLSISTKSGTMEEIDAVKGQKEAGSITLLDGAGQLLYEGEAESISGRGNSTFGLLKKPYQFKLKESADLFGFGKAKSFNLLADGYDETKLRNQIALGLAKELDMEYVPDGQSVDVYCNGVYYGIYYLCEKVQIGEGRVEITDMEENTRAVYSDTELENLESAETEDGSRRWTTSEVETGDLTGGYLFERELEERYKEEKCGFVTEQGDAYALLSPGYATEAQVYYIADYMQEFQDALWEKDGVNKETGKHYSEYIDFDSFVKKYLVEEISRNYDGGVTSSFFYKKSDAQGGKLYAGPVWDYDVAFGNCNLDEIASNPVGISMLNDHMYGTELFAKLYEKEEFYERAVALYEEKALPYLESLLDGGIDELSQQTAQSVKLDGIRWEELENRYRYYEEYENDIRYLKYYIGARRDFLNEVWLEGEVYHSITFMVDGEAWKKIYVKDGETPGCEPIPTRYSSLFMGWLSESYDAPYDEFKPVYEDMVFYATWQQLPVEDVVITTGEEAQ